MLTIGEKIFITGTDAPEINDKFGVITEVFEPFDDEELTYSVLVDGVEVSLYPEEFITMRQYLKHANLQRRYNRA